MKAEDGGKIGEVLGYPVFATTKISADNYLIGDFSQLAIANWGGLEIAKNDFYDELVQLYQLKILSYQISSPKFGRFLSNDPFEHLRTDSKLIQNCIFWNHLVGETRVTQFWNFCQI